MANTETRVKIKPNLKLSEPPLFNVVYLNDNVTTLDFVVDSLIMYFDYEPDVALNVTEKIHNDGSSVVAILPYEIAEQKSYEVIQLARDMGYPLQVKLESSV